MLIDPVLGKPLSTKRSDSGKFTYEAPIDVSMASFAKDVLDASQQKVILVDFWAPWCAPCRQFMPRLEAKVASYHGKVRLAKINIEEHKQLAIQMRVQSVPLVYLFANGQPVEAFSGVVSDSILEEKIQKALNFMGLSSGGDLKVLLDEALSLFNLCRYDEASLLYAQILSQNSECWDALIGLIRCALTRGEIDKAEGLLRQLPLDSQKGPQAESLKAHWDLLAKITSGELVLTASNMPFSEAYTEALRGIRSGDLEASVEILLQILRRYRSLENDRAKKVLTDLFQALGHTHKVSSEGLRQLSSVLFS